ncbi:hypothetical protein LPJ66_000996 [Kickxella alabastrina]|uniref:Uncharacterized protein n=1 Tax=Kickxella alabastrina TaxID=61397 RepID=A0ACC1IUE7_9FUNG|nr:hypothetical protein LPJ66_000996 [Kickxella alabastrina]
MRLFGFCIVLLALSGAALAGKFSPVDDEFSYGDEIKIECARLGEKGQELGTNKAPRWISPACVETRRPLSVHYGRDGPTQCSVKADDGFHETLLRSISLDQPLRCRVKRNKLKHSQYLELAIKVDGVKVRGSGGRTKDGQVVKRIGGNFNVVFHGQKGNLVAGAVYPVIDQPLPETVSGVTTMQFNQRWYEGTGMTVLMATKRHEEAFIIQPVVAIMFCILTACVVYVVGRVYVEGALIPKVLKEYQAEQGIVTINAGKDKGNAVQESKKTK